MRSRQKQQCSKKHIRGFTLVELLAVILIVGILMGVFVPVVSNKVEQARSLEVQNKMRMICQTYQAYLWEKGTPIDASTSEAFARELAKKTGLGANDGNLWFIEGDPDLGSSLRPKSAAQDNWGVVSSFVVAKNISAQSPGYTPLIWTRGLNDGTAFGTGASSRTPLRKKGGFIGFLDGKVAWCESNTDLFLCDGKSGSAFNNNISSVLSSLLN